jgi:hypothetical protein
MRTKLLILTAAVLTLIQIGCATTFRAGGRNGGANAGTAIGPTPAPVVIQEGNATPPPPVAR